MKELAHPSHHDQGKNRKFTPESEQDISNGNLGFGQNFKPIPETIVVTPGQLGDGRAEIDHPNHQKQGKIRRVTPDSEKNILNRNLRFDQICKPIPETTGANPEQLGDGGVNIQAVGQSSAGFPAGYLDETDGWQKVKHHKNRNRGGQEIGNYPGGNPRGDPEHGGGPEAQVPVPLEDYSQKDRKPKGVTIQDVIAEKIIATRRPQGQVKREKRDCRSRELRLLGTIEPEAVNRVQGKSEWECIDLAVDSGASETVIVEDLLQNVPIKEGDASRRGVQYEVANGVRIPNLGEKRFRGFTEEGTARSITSQVCEVNKGLLSVRRVVDVGHRVVFDADGSFIEDKITGERMWMKDEGGMYMLRMWVRGEGF